MTPLEINVIELQKQIVDTKQFEMIQELNRLLPIQPEYQIATPNELFELELKAYQAIPIQFQVNHIQK